MSGLHQMYQVATSELVGQGIVMAPFGIAEVPSLNRHTRN